jgi:hypothetical protein
MSVRHIMVVSDSAFSGALTAETERLLVPVDTTNAQRKWMEASVARRSRTALASGGLKPVLDSGGGGHSVFARAFLDALKQNDDILPGNALAAEVNHRVTEAASHLQIEQEPQYGTLQLTGDRGGEFFFVPHKTSRSL